VAPNSPETSNLRTSLSGNCRSPNGKLGADPLPKYRLNSWFHYFSKRGPSAIGTQVTKIGAREAGRLHSTKMSAKMSPRKLRKCRAVV